MIWDALDMASVFKSGSIVCVFPICRICIDEEDSRIICGTGMSPSFSVDLMGLANGNKGVLVNLMDDVQKLGVLVDGEGHHNHLFFLTGITSDHMEDGRTAIQLSDDFLADGLPLFGNDLGHK